MHIITPIQCQCARVLLEWDQNDLARRCDLHVQTICLFETRQSTPTRRTLDKITIAFENAGIEFLEGDGVKKKTGEIRTLYGVDGFRTFMEDVYKSAKIYGGNICLFNSKPSLWIKHLGKEWYDIHAARMAQLGKKIHVRIAVQEGETGFILPIAEHRWLSGIAWKEKIVYTYGKKLAFLDFSNDTIHIVIMNSEEFKNSFEVLFNIAWKHATQTPPSSDG
ncbi:MAG: hypothetical protein ACRBDL_08630 [Alphaproteobacteria bacterium]